MAAVLEEYSLDRQEILLQPDSVCVCVCVHRGTNQTIVETNIHYLVIIWKSDKRNISHTHTKNKIYFPNQLNWIIGTGSVGGGRRHETTKCAAVLNKSTVHHRNETL